MNVLCDRHHGGLYRSMQLLADRLGWTLHTPVGTEWASEGYWRFGQNQGITDDLARQYLALDAYWQPLGELHLTHDPEFPMERIYGVTLDVARTMPWAYIVATLDDNQHGFRRFADETAAGYVLQVGNTGQYVDWSLDPMALVSSEVPIMGRGVRYHQEMDPRATVFADPALANIHHISSFVNCMPSIQCYPVWQMAQAALDDDFLFLEFGIQGLDGVQKPIDLIARLMAMSAFGWHDKAHGDGFGHVLHGWAAVGRPIIGHGHHYAGKMGGVFWRHGETCIDLDVVTFDEAMAMVREIAADPDRHARMCRAIRAVYDAVVDNDAETDSIRDLLGLGVAVAA